MKGIWPDYILRYGWTDDTMWIDFKKINGTEASKLAYKRICKKSLRILFRKYKENFTVRTL